MKRKETVARLVIPVLMCAGVASSVQADCGSIPYYSPLAGYRSVDLLKLPDGSEDVRFDPLDIVVYEPGQRAIILWNGREESLLLSTEIKTSEPVSILEVIPFPSEPVVGLGDFETFEKMQALLIKKTMWTVASGGGVPDTDFVLPSNVAQITFHETMGAHDIAVMEVFDEQQFLEWVSNFLASKRAINPRVDPAFVTIIGNYLARGCRWLVFDTLEARDSVQSRQPVEYRFLTEQVYFPLEISTRETGLTTVDLLLVTGNPVSQAGEPRFAFETEKGVTITRAELQDISGAWADLMGIGEMTMQRFRFKGDIREFKQDFLAR